MISKSIFYGDNLRIARLMSGLSLNELGERVGTTRQYIHQLETSDKKIPTDDLLNALSFELSVDKEFFTSSLGNQVKEEECHFRKLKTTLVSARRECTAWATMLNRLVELLDVYLDLPGIDFPQIDTKSIADAEKAAATCRAHWQLGDGPIKSMVRVLENAGAIVSSFGEISEKVDALSLHRSRPIVLINPSKSAPRTRMDLAHETGHIVMHAGLETGDPETEAQADYFASEFLLPKHILFKEYERNKSRIDWNSVKNLKIKWGVSCKSIVYRLNQLEIITPSQYRTANIHLSKTGQTHTEWYDECVPLEKPELILTCLELLGNAYGNGLGGLIDRMNITKKMLSTLVQNEFILSFPDAENVISINQFRK